MHPAPIDPHGGAAPVARKPLRGVTKGRIEAPWRILVYSAEGVGKTTLASDTPNPIFLGKESGTEQLDVHRLPEPTRWREGAIVKTSDGDVKLDCFSLVDDLLYSDHDRKTVVIDTIDWIEPLVHQWVCANSRDKNGSLAPVTNLDLAFGGYGKGYNVALDEFRRWISHLERLRSERGMNILVLGHAHTVKIVSPEGEDYDSWGLKVHKSPAGLLREWCDAVFFAKLETFAAEKEGKTFGGGKRRYAVGSAVRKLYTQQRPSWYAKNRFNLPEELPLDWHAIEAAIKAHAPANVEEIETKIRDVAGMTSADVQTEVPGMIARCAGKADLLVKVLNWVQAQVDDTIVKPAAVETTPAVTENA